MTMKVAADLLEESYLTLAGGTLTGALTLAGDPTNALDAASKQYVDGLAANLGKRQRVRAATTANITISTALNNGDVIDGVTLVTGDLVLVKDQSTASQNGVYVVGASPARFSEFDAYDEYPGSLIAIAEGTTNADTIWLCTSNAGGTLGTTSIVFAKFTASSSSSRELLSASRTYYVRSDGSDSNNGVADTSGGAFLTIQKAIDVVSSLDLGIYDATIQVQDGTWTQSLTLKTLVGAGRCIIQGNTGNSSSVIISTTSANSFVSSGHQGVYQLSYLKMQTTTSGDCINVIGNGQVWFANVVFGACAGQHLRGGNGAKLVATGAYTINGGAQRHIYAYGKGHVVIQLRTITLSGTPAFSSYFAECYDQALLSAEVVTFSGSATGARHYVRSLSGVATGGGGTSYLPGNSAGTVDAATYGLFT